MKLTNKQKAVLGSYLRGVLASALTLITSNELGLDPRLSILLSAVAGPLAKALDKSEKTYGIGSK